MRVRIASAGTGKTTSLVLRYLELIDSGVPLGRVAGVTFTRAAAGELRQRVADGIAEVLARGDYLGGAFVPSADERAPHERAPFERAPFERARFERARDELGGAVLSTIHGFMIAALRLNAPALGLDPGFTLLGEWEAAAIFEEEVKGLLLLAAAPDHPLRAASARLGESAAPRLAALFAARSLAPRLTFGATAEEAALRALYRAALAAYDRRLGGASLAPGEVERRAFRMLGSARARERLAKRFPRVLVDEYQDVNPLQGAFFEQLAAAGVALELVGDPKQSIYGFRNADVTVFRRALDGAVLSGELQPPLTESRRHARALVGFLNRLTGRLAEKGLGFVVDEAPPVTAAGAQAAVAGSVELVVVEGGEPLDALRGREAEVLAERLLAHHDLGVPWDDMAVLARSHAALTRVLGALQVKGVPAFVVQARGYYERSEIRDVKHALAVGVDPLGASLLPFLRSPLAGLTLPEIEALARTAPEERLGAIRAGFPALAERMERLAELARATPLEAVEGILRYPVGDHRFQDSLRRRGRANVDALLFDVAAEAPRDLALFLQRLDLLAEQAEAGDVPQGGTGVRLLSVHASKGLEFPLVALFDVGAWGSRRGAPLLVEPGSGAVRLAGAPGFAAAQAAAWQRADQESYRLLYVAVSRARDALVMTGSRRVPPGAAGTGPEADRAGAGPWLAALLDLGLEGADALPGVGCERVPYAPPATPQTAVHEEEAGLEPAPWIDARLASTGLPPVVSPSALARLGMGGGDAEDEPLDPAERYADEDEAARGRVGWGRALGTLAHFAIGQGWRVDDPRVAATLAAQEVLVPFDEAQRGELVAEVLELLARYWALVGTALPALEARSVDRAELPLAVRRGDTVWEGVVDRLYRVGDDWFLDDYKTDRHVRPERYHLQLGHYLGATAAALGARPRARLVYLRHGKVVEPEVAALEAALARAGP